MDLTVLASELTDDPLSRGYSGMSDAAAAADLNAVTNRTKVYELGPSEFNAWAAGGPHSKIADASDRLGAHTAISHADRSLALSALRMLDRTDSLLDLSSAEHMGFVDAMVTASIIDADDKTALVARATKTVSRGVELGLGLVGEADVQDARA